MISLASIFPPSSRCGWQEDSSAWSLPRISRLSLPNSEGQRRPLGLVIDRRVGGGPLHVDELHVPHAARRDANAGYSFLIGANRALRDPSAGRCAAAANNDLVDRRLAFDDGANPESAAGFERVWIVQRYELRRITELSTVARGTRRSDL